MHMIANLFMSEPQQIQDTAPLLGSEIGKECAERFYSMPHIFIRELWGYLIDTVSEQHKHAFDL
jgi:hypothetical protein